MNLMDTSKSVASKMIKPATIALTSLALGIIWDVFFFGHQWGIVVPLFTVIIFGVIAVFDRLTHKHLSWYEISLAGMMFLISIFFALRDAEFLLGVNAVAMTYLFLMLMVSLYGAQIKKFKVWDFALFPFTDGLVAIIDRVSIIKELKRRKGKSSRVVRGTILALIVGAVFIGLFVAADEVVRELLTRLVNVEDIVDLFDDLIIIGLVSGVFLFGLAPAFWKRVNPREIKDPKAQKELGIETAIVLGMSNLVFAAFMVIQAVYLFGGESSLQSLGLTYAEYARKGFGQLLVVALLVIGITWAVRMIRSEKFELVNKVLNGSLLVLTLGVLWSSWTRLSLYEDAFGFTQDRLFSHYFLIVVAVVLAILFVGLFTKLKNNSILHSIVFTFAVALIGLNLLNPDAFIAQHNIDRGDTGEGIDYRYLFDLSDDAAEAISDHISSDEFKRDVAFSESLMDEVVELKRDLATVNGVIQGMPVDSVSDQEEVVKLRNDNAVRSSRIRDLQNALGYDTTDYIRWITDYEYNDEWQAWNLARWKAKIIHEQF